MENKQIYIDITPEELTKLAVNYRDNGYRLAQICATKKESIDLLYSLAKDGELVNLRLVLTEEQKVESISSIFAYSYLYENEIKELYGVDISGINVDFKGQFYKVAVPTPFNRQSEQE